MSFFRGRLVYYPCGWDLENGNIFGGLWWNYWILPRAILASLHGFRVILNLLCAEDVVIYEVLQLAECVELPRILVLFDSLVVIQMINGLSEVEVEVALLCGGYKKDWRVLFFGTFPTCARLHDSVAHSLSRDGLFQI